MDGNLSREQPLGWPFGLEARPFLTLDKTGLILEGGVTLAPMAERDDLAVDWPRIFTLLSVVCRRPVPLDILSSVDTAASHWRRGDKALANFRLMFGWSRTVDDREAVDRARLAERLLDAGMPPRVLIAELGLVPPPAHLEKYDPYQPRVPQGQGRESGRWRAIWDGINDWLDEPVPEYDQDTGLQVGSRSRAQAIATNPLTVGIAGAAALLGGEAVLPTAAEAVTVVEPAVQETRIAANAARGLESEARVLKDMGLTKNTRAVRTSEGRSIPDALTETILVEIKDTAYVGRVAQVRIQTEAAKASGRNSLLVVGERTKVSAPAKRAFGEIVRRSDLGPR